MSDREVFLRAGAIEDDVSWMMEALGEAFYSGDCHADGIAKAALGF